MIIIQQTSLKLKLSPMCTTAEIAVSIPPGTPEGSGSISVSYRGLSLATISLAVKRPGQQQQQTPLPQALLQNIHLLAGSAMLALVAFIAVRRLSRRPG